MKHHSPACPQLPTPSNPSSVANSLRPSKPGLPPIFSRPAPNPFGRHFMLHSLPNGSYPLRSVSMATGSSSPPWRCQQHLSIRPHKNDGRSRRKQAGECFKGVWVESELARKQFVIQIFGLWSPVLYRPTCLWQIEGENAAITFHDARGLKPIVLHVYVM